MVEKPQHILTEEIINKLENKQSIAEHLPDGSFLYMERPLPYLCVYSSSKDDFSLAQKLVQTEAAYLLLSEKVTEEALDMLREYIRHLSDHFGAFLLVQIWMDEELEDADFTIYCPSKQLISTAEQLQKGLIDLPLNGKNPTIAMEKVVEDFYPKRFWTLLDKEERKKLEVLELGLKIRPIYLNPETNKPYPIFFRSIYDELSEVLKKTFFEFIRVQTNFKVLHFNVLKQTEVSDLAWHVDEQLVEISTTFPFLMLVTPVNAAQAWEEFQENNYRKDPIFHYRLIPVDPESTKRKLFNIPIEDIDDPTLAFLFRDKRNELEKMLTMLTDRGTPDFRYSSMQVFGGVDEKLKSIAEALLIAIPEEDEDEDDLDYLDAHTFAARAREEIDFLKQQYEPFDSEVKVREDVSGLIVSNGSFYIGENYRINPKRVEALIQHEIGTHVLTYQNGKAQPLKQLYSGVPGYEELQEGLAVLSEYLVGGLTNKRLRLLAARVLGVYNMINGASFCSTFSMLHDRFNFSARGSFFVTTRIYRGGGLTKDAVYLRGLVNLLEYLKEGNELESLLIGKIRQDYIPIVQELIDRKILNPVPLKPRYMLDEQYNFTEKKKELQKGITVFNLIKDLC